MAAVGVCFFSLRDKEPAYNGRTLSEWLDKFDKSIPAGRHWPSIEPEDATDAIHHLGQSNSTLLAHWLVDDGSKALVISHISDRNAFLKRVLNPLRERTGRKSYFGWLGLKILGTNARPAIPILKGGLQSPDPIMVNAASNALFHVAPEIVTNRTSITN